MLCMTVSHRRELAQARLQGTQRNYPIEYYCLELFTELSLTIGIYLAIILDTTTELKKTPYGNPLWLHEYVFTYQTT